jgi:hypothetical protein
MNRLATVASVAGLALAVSAFRPARAAESPETTADLRCMVATATALGSIEDPRQKAVVMMAGAYYLGRLDGREAKLDLNRRLMEVRDTMSPADVRSELKRCGAQMIERGKALQQPVVGPDPGARPAQPGGTAG